MIIMHILNSPTGLSLNVCIQNKSTKDGTHKMTTTNETSTERKPTFLILILLGGILFSAIPKSAFAQLNVWQKTCDLPASNQNLTSALSHPLNPGSILITAKDKIYIKEPKGESKIFWQAQGIKNDISKVFYFDSRPKELFVATRDTIFNIDLVTQKSRVVFRHPQTSAPKNIFSFAVDPDDTEQWFAGTSMGLFESDNAGKIWQRLDNVPKTPITGIAFLKDRLLISTASALLISLDFDQFKTVFRLNSSVKEETSADLNDNIPEEYETVIPQSSITALISSKESGRAWIGTNQGVYESADSGNTCQTLSSSGMRIQSVRHLIYDEPSQRLFAGTQKGIYAFDAGKRQWNELYRGLIKNDALALWLRANPKTLLALTSNGVWQYPIDFTEIHKPHPISILSPEKTDAINLWINREPGCREVQKMAVDYSNLKNGKINRWHAQSRLASLLPDLSFGKDFSRSNNNDVDRGSTSDRDTFISGPDDINQGWDFNISWDLGDLIFNSSQTSIDGREKLMVELRNEVLSEVTRLYYERRRLQKDFLATPPETSDEHTEIMLRIDELTALIDGMTGGKFGYRLERLMVAEPELSKVWEFAQSAA